MSIHLTTIRRMIKSSVSNGVINGGTVEVIKNHLIHQEMVQLTDQWFRVVSTDLMPTQIVQYEVKSFVQTVNSLT